MMLLTGNGEIGHGTNMPLKTIIKVEVVVIHVQIHAINHVVKDVQTNTDFKCKFIFLMIF